MYPLLLAVHSWLRWFLLIVLVIVLIRSFLGWFSQSKYTKLDNLFGVLLIAFAHTQLVLGLVLYFISPNAYPAIQREGMKVMKDANLRVWSVEHLIMMIVAVALIQIGRSVSKAQATDTGKHQRMAIFVVMALAVIFLGIPKDRLMLFRF